MPNLFALNERFATIAPIIDLVPDDSVDLRQKDPSVARLATGGFVVAWAEGGNLADGSATSLSARVFDANSQPVSTILAIASGLTNFPSVAGLAGGGFVVVWSQPDDSGDGIRAQAFAADGTPRSGAFQVPTATSGNQNGAQVAALIDGNFAVVWVDQPTTDIRIRIFSPTGAALTGEINGSVMPAATSLSPDIAALSGGGFAITWFENFSGGGASYVQAYSNNGSPLNLSAAPGAGAIITGLAGGGFALGVSTTVRIFDAAARQVGSDISVGTITESVKGISTLAGSDDGGFVVTRTVIQNPGTTFASSALQLQSFDLGGVPFGDPVMVGVREVQRPTLSAFGTNDLVLTHVGITGAGRVDFDQDAYVQTLFGATNGTAGADTMIGGEASNYLRGLAGNDSLVGGAAADVLDGGAGADTMRGGDGDDTYYVDDAGDQIFDTSGYDIVITSISYALPFGGTIEEVRAAAGNASINLTGDFKGNVLTGNNGANILNGFGGPETAGDTLSGASVAIPI